MEDSVRSRFTKRGCVVHQRPRRPRQLLLRRSCVYVASITTSSRTRPSNNFIHFYRFPLVPHTPPLPPPPSPSPGSPLDVRLIKSSLTTGASLHFFFNEPLNCPSVLIDRVLLSSTDDTSPVIKLPRFVKSQVEYKSWPRARRNEG